MALVTGANRGLGFEACRQLAQCGFHVILTSRDRQRGPEAASVLCAEGLDITCHMLDVTNLEHVEAIHDAVIDEHGRLDVPIEIIGKTLDVNFYGALHMIRAFVPVMKAHNYGRVVNVSSIGGSLSLMFTLRGRMAAYRISKAALNAVTRLTAGTVKDWDIKVNSMCPGRIRTRMGGASAPRTPAQGAETMVWLATLPRRGPSGKFFTDRVRLDW
ncbi:MAG TPA: SDR family NAD(P)-dependent oxidoreductase [Anaerolineae bacterium]|nr:SDR family NAD(P)-dependent oxidoreductase [Anaerolineae bacterium]